MNLVVSRRVEKEIRSKKQVNCFLELPLENRFMFNMLKNAKVNIVEREKVAYVVGQAAIDMAYTLPSIELKRPMKDGCLNPQEKDAFKILSIMIHSLMGEVDKDKDILYYSVPANAINQETDADYHSAVLASIFKAYNVNGKTVQAFPINEGLCLVFAELLDKHYTGVGLSFGAGAINLCYAIFSQPVFQMSLVNSGDWIDKQAGKASGESPTVINKEKMKIDLTKPVTSIVERAIKTQYELLVQKTVTEIKKAIVKAGTKAHVEQPLDIILGGGVSLPNGFQEMFAQAVKESQWPIVVGQIKKAADPLLSISHGALIAAENHTN
jgi:actin-like ATPase involved in cell morphogenesis